MYVLKKNVNPITGDIMIQYYKIRNINNEEILFIYLNYDYEFGELGKKNTSILNQVKNTIEMSKFTGAKIIIMAGTIALATLLYTGNSFKGNIIEDNSSNLLSPRIVEKNNLFENPKILNIENINNSANSSLISENSSFEENNIINIDSEKIEDNFDTNKQTQQQNTTINNSSNQNETSTGNSIPQAQQPAQNTSTNTNQNNTTSQLPEQPVTQQPVQPEESKTIVTVYRNNGTVIQIELEEYLVGVVAAEIPASFNIEALKAQAIVARTYTLKRMSRGLILTDTVATQEYIDTNQMKTKWQGDFQKYYDKIKLAVDSTKGKYITYNGVYIDAVYHSTSNGYTEDSEYVWGNSIPYLKSVDSSWDKSASSYLRTETKDNNIILSILGISINSNTPVEVLSRNASGRITLVKIGDSTYTGVNLRNMLGLRSADFDIVVQDGNLIFTTRGYGHGVGMSQYGANGMANAGYNYNQILTHYYQGVNIVG